MDSVLLFYIHVETVKLENLDIVSEKVSGDAKDCLSYPSVFVSLLSMIAY